MDNDTPTIMCNWPVAMRVFFIGIGAFVIGISVRELAQGLWPPNLATPVFAIIIGGAVMVGSVAITAGLWGEDQRWHFPAGAIVIERRIWQRCWQSEIRAADVAGICVTRRDTGEGRDTWFVRLRLADGPEYLTQDYATEADAQAVRDWLDRHLLTGATA